MLSQRNNNSSSSRRSRCREGQMFQLVKMYHSHRCLWDRHDPDYKNKVKRYQSFKAIGIALNLFSLEDVKKKIKSMRDTYTAEKNRMKKSLRAGAGSDEVYRTKLSWYSFADSFFNGSEAPSSEISSHVPETIDGPLDRDDKDCIIIPEYENQYTELVEMECTYDDQSTPDSSEPVHQYPTKRSKQNAKNQQEIPRGIPTNIETEPDGSEVLYTSSAHDELYYFGMNVACQLRTLPKINALVLQDKINKLIFDDRLQYESHIALHQSQTEVTINDKCYE